MADGAVKTFEGDTGKPVNTFFEHSGWVTEFFSWFVQLCFCAYMQFQLNK